MRGEDRRKEGERGGGEEGKTGMGGRKGREKKVEEERRGFRVGRV